MDRHQDRSRGSSGAMPWRIVGLAGLLLGGMVLGPALGNSTVMRAHEPAAPAPLVFDMVTVIDVEQGRLLKEQRVVIVGNHIRTMGSVLSVPMPVGAHVVHANGKYLIPGAPHSISC
jgi:hypothetical protein